VGEVHAFEPHYEGSPVVWQMERDPVDENADTPAPCCSAQGAHRFEARPGHHLAPAVLSSGANIFECLGTGYTLLAVGPPADTAPASDVSPSSLALAIAHFRSQADAMGLPLDVVTSTPDGEAGRYGAALVLVRPDAFVAWVGEPEDLDAKTDAKPVREVLRLVQYGDLTYSAPQRCAAANAG